MCLERGRAPPPGEAREAAGFHSRTLRGQIQEVCHPREKSKKVSAPRFKGSFAQIERRVITAPSAAGNSVYLAEAVAFKVDKKSVPMAWFNNNFYALNQATLS
jgi:flavin reductase (DIM6/NTAB) family NADH-FMN oxidoreductase RutF